MQCDKKNSTRSAVSETGVSILLCDGPSTAASLSSVASRGPYPSAPTGSARISTDSARSFWLRNSTRKDSGRCSRRINGTSAVATAATPRRSWNCSTAGTCRMHGRFTRIRNGCTTGKTIRRRSRCTRRIADSAGPDPSTPGRRSKPLVTLLARPRSRCDPLSPVSWPARCYPGLNSLELRV